MKATNLIKKPCFVSFNSKVNPTPLVRLTYQTFLEAALWVKGTVLNKIEKREL